jgi:hypothetical protein
MFTTIKVISQFVLFVIIPTILVGMFIGLCVYAYPHIHEKHSYTASELQSYNHGYTAAEVQAYNRVLKNAMNHAPSLLTEHDRASVAALYGQN